MAAKQIVGLDITSAAIEHLRSQFPGRRFHLADITEVRALPGESRFDVVSAFDVLFHIVDDLRYRQAIANIHSFLRPGGLFLHSDIFTHLEAVRGRHYVYRPLAEVEGTLREAGFDVVDRRPMFVLMNVPIDTQNRARKLAWGALQTSASASRVISYLLGAALYPLEIPLTAILRESASTEVMICKKVDNPKTACADVGR
jgi:SAM-dependent methyltransferase